MNFLEPAGPQMFQNFWRSKMSAGKQIPAKLKWLITTALIVFFTPLVWVCSAGWKRSNPTMGWAGGDLKDHFTPTYPRCSNLVWGRKYSDCVHVCCYLALSGKSYFKLQIFFFVCFKLQNFQLFHILNLQRFPISFKAFLCSSGRIMGIQRRSSWGNSQWQQRCF